MSTDILENPTERARANARMALMRRDLSPAQKHLGRWSRAPNGWAPSCFITERDARLCMVRPDGTKRWSVRVDTDLVEIIWRPMKAVILTPAAPVVPKHRQPPRDSRDWRYGDEA